MLKTAIELIGPSGSGKSILSKLLGQTLQPIDSTPLNILLIDACVDQGLTYQCIPKHEWASFGQAQTLTNLVQHLIENETRYRLKGSGPIQRQEAQQSLDWAFSNLPSSIQLDNQSEVDLLTVGILTEHLPAVVIESLSYGLKRLMMTYDYVIIDGYHPLIHPMLLSLEPDSLLTPIIVVRPTDNALLPASFQSIKTPALLITQFRGETLSQSIQQTLNSHEMKLIGKIPVFTTEEAFSPTLMNQFYDCLRFLDIPLLNTQSP